MTFAIRKIILLIVKLSAKLTLPDRKGTKLTTLWQKSVIVEYTCKSIVKFPFYSEQAEANLFASACSFVFTIVCMLFQSLYL